MKWELDLWYEMWDRAGSQGLDTWYDMKGRLKREQESESVRGPNLDDPDGTADGNEGERVKNVMVVQVTALRVERSGQVESKLIAERESRIPKTGHSYTWLEDYLVRLDGKEARGECYAWLE